MRLALLAAVVLGGCTHARTLDASGPDPWSSLNRQTARAAALVTLADGRKVRTRSLHVAPDLATWLAPETGRAGSVATGEIVEVRVRSRGRGVLDGLGIGAAVAVAAAAYGAALGAKEDTGAWAAVGAVGVGGPALAVGAVAGFVQGADVVYAVAGGAPRLLGPAR